MIVERSVSLETGYLALYEDGSVQLCRDNGTFEFLNPEEAESIRDLVCDSQ